MIELVSFCKLTSSVTMRLLLRGFIGPWLAVALIHGQLRVFAFRPTATMALINEGLQLATYPDPTPFPRDFLNARRLQKAAVSNPTCGWVDGNKGTTSKLVLDLALCR
jgi:hypothetical protein